MADITRKQEIKPMAKKRNSSKNGLYPKLELSGEIRNSKLFNNDTTKKVPFSVVEAYKNLRVHLTSILKEQNIKVIAITSPNASEGKSTTAVNTAIVLSQLNKKVVLVDADARRSTVHSKLKLQNKIGCLDVMVGKETLKKAIQPYNQCLDIITAGSDISGTSELFCSSSFDRLLTDLSAMYDYVIVDTPPVNLVSDSLVISQKCEGVLLVVRSSITTYAAFKKAYSSIEKLNINVLGTVINGVGSKSDKYYKYDKYKYGYGYGSYGYGYGYYGKDKK